MLPFPFNNRTSILALSSFSFATLALNAQEGVRLSTPTFGFQTEDKSPDGKRYAYLYDADGNVLKTIPADACMAAAGRLGGYVLFDYQVIDSKRKLEVYDDQGKLKGSFDVYAKMEPFLGEQGVALLVFNEHGIFRPYEITFLDPAGKVLAQHSKKARLLGLELFENDHWVANSLDVETGNVVLDHFDAVGKLLWSYDTKQREWPQPAIAISPSGARSAVRVSLENPRGDFLTVLDDKGQVSFEPIKVPFFHEAAFSPDEPHLALAGFDGIQLRNAADGALVWEDLSRRHTVRDGLKWSSDGTGLYVLTLEPDENGDPTSMVLAQYSVSSSMPLLAKTFIATLDDGTLPAAVELLVDDPVVITVVLSTGRVTLPRL